MNYVRDERSSERKITVEMPIKSPRIHDTVRGSAHPSLADAVGAAITHPAAGIKPDLVWIKKRTDAQPLQWPSDIQGESGGTLEREVEPMPDLNITHSETVGGIHYYHMDDDARLALASEFKQFAKEGDPAQDMSGRGSGFSEAEMHIALSAFASDQPDDLRGAIVYALEKHDLAKYLHEFITTKFRR